MAELVTPAARALLVVEPRFAAEHVGVRRVIVDYWHRLEAAGYSVDLGVVASGELHLVSAAATAATRRSLTNREPGRAHTDDVLDLRRALVHPVSAASFDVSIISNPWLCDQLMPQQRFTHGIVYDLVPNLLAAQAMDFGTPNWVAGGFAYSHHRGYQFFLDNVDTILCISASTRTDFLRYYSPDDEASVVVDIPFDVDRFRAANARGESTPDARPAAARVLLVNVLDPRKNIAQVSKALADVSATTRLAVDIVGANRLPPDLKPRQFVKQMASNGAQVTWHENASDELLIALYQSSDILVFPSLYEGLGLPILEAQSYGLPCISSSGSSLGEVNLNASLFVDPRDASDIARLLAAFIDRSTPALRGDDLIDATRSFLDTQHRFESTLPAPATVTPTGT